MVNTQSFNRYSYVLNNPLSMTDPTGRDGCTTPIATDPATFAVSCSASVIGDAACGPLCGEVIGDVVGAIAAGLEAIFGFGGPSFHGSLQPRPSAPSPNSSATSTQIYSYPPKADLTPINPGAPYTFQAYAVTGSIPDIAPELPNAGEIFETFAAGAEVVAAPVIATAGLLWMQGDNASTRGPWTCVASCNLQGIGTNVPPMSRVTGTASGSSETNACLNAKRVATQSAPRGTYARHCQCSCIKS